jgi:hypothetical protein
VPEKAPPQNWVLVSTTVEIHAWYLCGKLISNGQHRTIAILMI